MKAFVINLDNRPDRLKIFNETFKQFDITRELAVCVTKISPELKKRVNEWNFKNLSDKKTKGVVGCCMSHLNIWEKISKMNENVIVFEDDCTFINENVKENFENYFNSLIFRTVGWMCKTSKWYYNYR